MKARLLLLLTVVAFVVSAMAATAHTARANVVSPDPIRAYGVVSPDPIRAYVVSPNPIRAY